MRTIPILFTFDDKLVLPACVCLSSLLRSADPETYYDIFIIHSDKYDLTKTDVAKIPDYYSNCRLTFRPISGEFVGGYEIRGIPETCYYRMLSPELIPEYDKILYSDVDVIFRDDLAKYYDVDLGDKCFGAVDNCSALRPSVQRYARDVLGIDPSHGFYCSGNLLINLKLIREEGLCGRFRELGRNNYRQQDMDIINIACNGRFYSFPPAFCLAVNMYRMIMMRREDMRSIYTDSQMDYALEKGIVHYNGAKPWNTWCHHFDIWWEAFRQSPFFDEKFYQEFYDSKEDELDRLTLSKRIKVLARYFIYGKKTKLSLDEF